MTNEAKSMADRLAAMAKSTPVLKNDTMGACGDKYRRVTATERASW